MFDNFFVRTRPSFFQRWGRSFFVGMFLVGGVGSAVFHKIPSPEFPDVAGMLESINGGDIVTSHEPIPIPPPPQLPILKASSTPVQEFSSASIIVKDPVSGTVLFGKDPYAK